MPVTHTVTLSAPVRMGGQEMTTLCVRRACVGDEEDAMQQAVLLGRARNPVTVEMCLLARVANLSYDAIRTMPGADYALLREAFNAVSGAAPDDEVAANPTTPPNG